jgi:hypothetical protein
VVRVEVALCSSVEVEVQPVGLSQVAVMWFPQDEEEVVETDEDLEVDVWFQVADARPTRPARMVKDFILLQIFKSESINYCF